MKPKLKTILALMLIATTIFSCSSDKEEQSQLSDNPTALKKFDSSNFGTYKGVFVGSTGTIVINFNDDNSKTAVLIIDGKVNTYTTTGNITNGQAITGLNFKNGDSSFDFSAGATGEEPNITNINIFGHPNASIEIQKEKSDKIVKCYVGTSADSDGSRPAAFNFYINGDKLVGIAHNDSGKALLVLGTVLSNNSFTGYVSDENAEEATLEGTIVGNSFKGTAINKAGDHFILSGIRAL